MNDRIAKALTKLFDWHRIIFWCDARHELRNERKVLYPLATGQVAIDLDDGVKVNYLKFGSALKKIAGLEAKEE